MLRSYDNRLRLTERRSDLYLEPVFEKKKAIALRILEIKDVKVGRRKSVGPIDRLWRYEGKLLIISTPYHEGMHYAKSPRHFLPVIDHLVQLHRQDYVHGDIRAYNMVLNYDTPSADTKASAVGTNCTTTGSTASDSKSCEGWLIDFDFGGKKGAVKYPKGYKNMLHDGIRPGKEGEKITIMDDWKSLIGLIFHTHRFVEKVGAQATLEWFGLTTKMRGKLETYRDMTVGSNDSLLTDYRHPAKLLKNFIKYVSDVFDVVPAHNFKEDLKNCGLWPTYTQSNASQAATGSPPK